MVDVEQLSDSEPMVFQVRVCEGSGETRHRVTMSQPDYERLSGGKVQAEALVQASFAFLLERESKESILSHFDITVIARYFPEFEQQFPACLPLTSEPENSKP